MRRIASSLAVSLALALAAPALAETAQAPEQVAAETPAPANPPRLIVAVSIDQFSADTFAQFRQHYSGGFVRLTGGVVFPSGYQSHAATETCPGHSTLLTGVHPSRNGIIANTWYEPDGPRGDKPIYCAEDQTDPASSPRNPVVSARNLKVPTLGEMMKGANPASRNVAVSAKDRAVVMMGGHKIDAGWWWKGGSFVSFKGTAPTAAVQAVNAKAAATIKAGAKAMPIPVWCKAADRAVPVGKTTLGTGRFALEAGKENQFRISPRMDAATVDLAIGLADEMNLGKGAATDLLSVSLSATDYVGHATGVAGAEMCILQNQLDQDLGRLFKHLDAKGIDYLVVLSADHGGLDMPERMDQQAFPAAERADVSLTPENLSKTVAAKTGITVEGPLVFGDAPAGDLYVSRKLTPEQRTKVIAALVETLKASPQVADAVTAEELAAMPLPTGTPQEWNLRKRARLSYQAGRSGDVLLILNRAVTPIPEAIPGAYVATHGSAYDYDRRVPILFWRKGLRPFEQPQPVETVDIAPTLAAVLGLKVADGTFDGRCLDLDGGAGDTCAK
ncbi:alkaline phosphatase family protein [Novosphingobium sp.]|uniref:alkaline phosphatase family protein n=1 Tax=Novosphingobium sp. TaxID=1874826 RepID=UPI0035B3D968